MTVETTVNTTTHLTNGATTVFPFYFLLLDAAHLVVRLQNFDTSVTTIVEAGSYSISGIGEAEGGSITFGSAPADGQRLIIQRIVPYKQPLDIVNQGGFYPDTLEEQLDSQVMQIQQLANEVDRAVKVPEGELPFEFPTATQRENKYISFDANGDLFLSAGTGADVGLREDLGSISGGRLVKLKDGSTVQAAVNAAADPISLVATTESYVEGSFIRTGDGYLYKVAASDATDAHITTAGGIKLYVVPLNGVYSAPAFAAVDVTSYQALLDAVPEGSTVLNPSNWSIDLTDGLTIDKRLKLSGDGLLNFTAGIEGKAAIQVNADGTVLTGIRIYNPNALGNDSGDRPYGIEIQAHDIIVSNCRIEQFQNAIAQRANGEWYRSIIIGNQCLNCLGAGGGQASSSSLGEDRGDGITAWGAGTVIANNIVTLKDGEDGRIGIHAERLNQFIITPGPYDDTAVSVVGNHIYGSWRRGIVFEGMRGATAEGNTIVGPTWWALAIVKGATCCVMEANTVYWTTTFDTWGSWSPTIAPLKLGFELDSCTMKNNTVYMAAGSKTNVGFDMQNTSDGVQTDCTMEGNKLLCEDDTVEFLTSLARISATSTFFPTRPVFKGNKLRGDAPDGLLVQKCVSPLVSENAVVSLAGSPVAGSAGIQLTDAAITHPRVLTNHCIGWEDGILCASVTSAGLIDGNILQNGTRGITVGGSFANIEITRNVFDNLSSTKISGLAAAAQYLAHDNQGQTLYAESVYDFASLNSGASASQTFTVTGAALGDFVEISASTSIGNLLQTATVTATDTVTVTLGNLTGSPVDPSSKTWKLIVRKIGNLS